MTRRKATRLRRLLNRIDRRLASDRDFRGGVKRRRQLKRLLHATDVARKRAERLLRKYRWRH